MTKRSAEPQGTHQAPTSATGAAGQPHAQLSAEQPAASSWRPEPSVYAVAAEDGAEPEGPPHLDGVGRSSNGHLDAGAEEPAHDDAPDAASSGSTCTEPVSGDTQPLSTATAPRVAHGLVEVDQAAAAAAADPHTEHLKQQELPSAEGDDPAAADVPRTELQEQAPHSAAPPAAGGSKRGRASAAALDALAAPGSGRSALTTVPATRSKRLR